MTNPDSLHELIHALSRQEKRYFKIYIGQKSGKKRSKYSTLFDLIAEMDDFDPEKLQAKMGWANFRSSYTMAKRYLHDKILESLAAYENPDSGLQQLKVLIQQIRILRNKQLHRQTSRKIALAKRLAYKIQDNIHLLEILIEERVLMIHNARAVFKGPALLKVNEEIQMTISEVRLEQQAQHLHYQFFTRMSLPSGQALAEIEGVMEELLNLKILDQKAFTPQITHYNALNQFHYFKGDYLASQKALAEIINLFEIHPEMIREYPSRYLANLHNYANRSILVNDYFPVLNAIRLIRDFPPKKNKIEAQRLESYFGIGLLLILNSGQISQNEGFFALVLDEIRKPKPRLSRRFLLNLKWMAAMWYLQADDLKAALHWTQEVSRDPTHTAIKVYSRLISLIEMLIHFEMGNEDWLEYRLRNYEIHLKQEAPFAFEELFVKYLKAIVRTPVDSSRWEVFAEFLAKIQELSVQPEEHAVFTFFDFEAWAIAKVEKTSFRQIVQKNWAAKGGIHVRINPDDA